MYIYVLLLCYIVDMPANTTHHSTSMTVFHTRVVCPLLGKASPPKERPKTSLGGRLQVTSENETQNKTKQSIILLGRFFAETVLFSAAIAALNQASSE